MNESSQDIQMLVPELASFMCVCHWIAVQQLLNYIERRLRMISRGGTREEE